MAVGVCMALEDDDYATGTYRGHGHALAKGTEPEPLAAEMLGRATGVCGGRAGSMNVIDIKHGLVGCFGIVGGSIAAATGAAISAKRAGPRGGRLLRRRRHQPGLLPRVPELRRGMQLPVVFVCENNLYGEFTPMAQVTAGADIAARAAGYGVPAEIVDGNDLWAVREAAPARSSARRAGEGPTLLECQTYRHHGHSKADPGSTAARGGRGVAGTRPAERGAGSACGSSGSPMTRWPASSKRPSSRIDRAVESALAAPYPDPAAEHATEFAP